MTPFLKHIAQTLLDLKRDELENTLVIVPSRRAKTYILKYISEAIDKPIYTPEIVSINDFIYKQTGLLEADPMDILMQLYMVHMDIEKANSQSLDQFSTWADLLLSDFNDIDLYMVPVDSLFSYLSDAKEIEKWDLDLNKLSEQEKNYLKFYKKLHTYYLELKKVLLISNTAYQGMAYRQLAEQANFDNINYSNIFIAGFNAFTKAEEIIVKNLETNHSAVTIWDIDRYYFENKNHEAGKSLREHLKNKDLNKVTLIDDYWLNNTKKINIYGVDGNVAQVKFAANLLQQQIDKDKNKIDNTALILASEDLLLPVINSIPNSVDKFNLTMSYPLRLHSGYELIKLVLNLYNDYKFEEDNTSDLIIYHKYFTNFILHPYIQKYLSVDSNIVKEITNDINKNNIQRIDSEYLLSLASKYKQFEEFSSIILNINRDVRSSIDIIIKIFNLLKIQENHDWEKSFLSHYIEVIQKLKESLLTINYIEKLTTVKRWVQNAINHSPIPFIGEPLQGLQIMGMLETRTLDFENIIILSVNEDILPKTQTYQSFILFDIKKEFGMPLPSNNDSISAYHFYRLLQRCNNVNLLYNAAAASMSNGEMSRFIKQIEIEIPELNSNIEINHKKVKFGFTASEKTQAIEIKKTDEIINYLKKWSQEKGFSPSSLNNYKRCTYMFYLQKVLNIKPSDKVEEKMAYNIQGNILHESLEDYYGNYKNKKLTFDEFNKTSNKIQKIFDNKLNSEYRNINTKTGKNLLTRKILEQYIYNFIKSEKNFLKENDEIRLLGLEENLIKYIDIDIEGANIKIKVKGSADRIDQVGNTIRLIDYKTGAVDESDLKLKGKKGSDKWLKMFEGKLDKAFQLMMYAWMYWDSKPPTAALTSSISALKNHSANFPLIIENDDIILQTHIDKFEEDLSTLILGLFDRNKPFVQRENGRECEYCDYRSICSR
ncbi:MAG: PD-(D/E)XK nuclease family protein [Bacteroidales bacterium]|nr:PD-(D/E)XK nuclease family protein [Bacteroidales bacterium]